MYRGLLAELTILLIIRIISLHLAVVDHPELSVISRIPPYRQYPSDKG